VTVQPPDANNVSECSNNEQGDSCLLTYDRGQHVTLTASSDTGRRLSSWSSPDCPGTGSCALALDDDVTSIVALFDPLRLGVVLSSPEDGTVTTDPVGAPCDQQRGDFCFEFAPGTRVKVTMASSAGHTFKGWNGGCEPSDATSCTITVLDEPTWVGARFDTDDPPQLATTIDVQFRLKRGGTGGGRVTSSDLDCGTVCSRQYGYGKSLVLTAAPDAQSVFAGWNGVCSKSQTACTVPVGPITSITARFDHDTAPPSSPAALAVSSATRTSIAVGWTASTDDVSVAGYRAYVDDTAAGNTTDTSYTFANLACGRRYTLGVDAVDEAGNRSPRATVDAETQACALAARVAAVGVIRRGGRRVVAVTVRANRATTALLTLARRRVVVDRGRFRVAAGANALRLAVPRRLPGGAYRLKVSLANPDGGVVVLAQRTILLPRAP